MSRTIFHPSFKNVSLPDASEQLNKQGETSRWLFRPSNKGTHQIFIPMKVSVCNMACCTHGLAAAMRTTSFKLASLPDVSERLNKAGQDLQVAVLPLQQGHPPDLHPNEGAHAKHISGIALPCLQESHHRDTQSARIRMGTQK